jgi:hypothetical protein
MTITEMTRHGTTKEMCTENYLKVYRPGRALDQYQGKLSRLQSFLPHEAEQSMNRPYKTEWIVPVLTDVAAFLAANGMKESSDAVVEAMAAVLMETQSEAIAPGPRQTVSKPVVCDNVVRFSVSSRQRN